MTIWTFLGRQWTSLPSPPKGDYLRDKVVLITGANSGIGLETIKHFCLSSHLPSKLILLVRSVEATEKILLELQFLHNDLVGEVIFLDLNDLNTIKSLPEELKKRGVERVDILINNAGANPGNLIKDAEFTKDNYEKTFQTNVLSPLLLSLTLLPFLQKSSKPKILFLGSGLHASANTTPIENALDRGEPIVKAFNDKESYDNQKVYGRSKLLLQMITRKLITSLPSISIITVSPGLAITNLGRDYNKSLAFIIFGAPFMLLNARSAEKGARNLTSAVAFANQSYDYWSECAPSYSESSWLSSGNGIKATEKFYKEMIQEIEKISPGLTKDLSV